MSNIKYIDIEEFVDKGYLQEANRRFFHPFGLALEVRFEGSQMVLGGIWDYRDDPEGIHYDLKNSSEERIKTFNVRNWMLEKELDKKREKRKETLGFDIEPIPDPKNIPSPE